MRTRSAIFGSPVFSAMQKRVRLVVMGVLLVLASISFIAFRSIQVLVNNTQQVKRSAQVIYQMKSLQSVLKDAENGQKSFLLARDRNFLQPYNGSLVKVLASFSALHQLFEGDTARLAQMAMVKEMVLIKYNLLKDNIRYVEATGKVSVPLLNQGAQLSDEISLQTDLMISHQQQVMNRYQLMLQSSANRALWVIFSFSIVAIVMCLMANRILLDSYGQKLLIQQDLEQKMEELKRSNQELEQFAYIASHDLQEPLRKIRAFGDMLVSHKGSYSDERAENYVSRMQHAAQRMQRLIDDILSFSRITRTGQPFAPCDLNKVISEVLQDLDELVKHTRAHIVLGRLHTVDGIEGQLRQLFQNLISNALKFTRAGEEPELRIKSRIIQGKDISPLYPVYNNKPFCEITVADNGIGFDEQYLEKIFVIFQRLHGQASYEGSGIGLAICKKIVDRHHGIITAKSKIDNGSTFIVYLPVQHINIVIPI